MIANYADIIRLAELGCAGLNDKLTAEQWAGFEQDLSNLGAQGVALVAFASKLWRGSRIS
jgi:hypothetical protein